MLRRHAFLALAVLGFWLAMRLAVAGVLPPWAAVACVSVTALLVVHRNRVLLLGTGIGLPFLGIGGLVDPWETHYAEVAREMIIRRDFISPWWANEGWFRTKPVLTFWLEAVSMLLFGARTGADEVLANGAHPEWAVRFPHFVLALAGSYFLASGVSAVAGKRAGFFAALVLWTMPGFALLSHQAMTDMPLVGGIAASLGLSLRALTTEEDETTEKGPWLAAAIALAVLPQLAAILLSHRLTAGDPNVCGLPGQPDCAVLAVAHPRLRPLVQIGLWVGPAGWLAVRAYEEKRAARLSALAAWAAAAIATMAKGPVGLVIPAAGVLAVFLLRPRSCVTYLRRLEVPTGLALVVVLVAPWYLAIYARHGRAFLDELVVRNMLGRTLDHLHDTNEGEDTGIRYFVRQLAYGTFPWCGILPLALLQRVRRRPVASALFAGAAVAGFVLITLMKTKFHHYMLICLPPLAALAGMWLASNRPRFTYRVPFGRRARWTLLLGLVSAAIVASVGHDIASSPARFAWLLTYRYARTWPSTHAFAGIFLVVTVITVAAALALGRRHLVACALAVILVDMYLPRCAEDGGQRDLLIAYYRDRPAPRPLIAYQLNWKGENFYTGNNVAIFVRSGAPLSKYLAKRRADGERTFYFETEIGRREILRRELGADWTISDVAKNAEFIIVKATI